MLTVQLNRIIQEEGLAASLIRPRRDPRSPKLSPTNPSTAAPGGSGASVDQQPSQTATVSTDLDAPNGMQVDTVDALANQLDSALALAFVPSAVRKKGGNKVHAGKVDNVQME
jgi:hypothetical protein